MTDLNDHDSAAIRSIGLGPDNAGPKFKVGQKWRDKIGATLTIEWVDHQHSTFPITAAHEDGRPEVYTREGRYYNYLESDKDLTTLVSDVDNTRCTDDGGICGVGGFCDDCPHVNHEIPQDNILASPPPVKTLRDEIAIAAMRALITGWDYRSDAYSQFATYSYEMADAMLRARERK